MNSNSEKAAQDKQADKESAGIAGDIAKNDKKKILLVDDDEDIAHIQAQGLSATGAFLVDTFTSPKRVLETFRPGVYDLAILDIRMPGMSGFMLYSKLREQDPTIQACFLSSFELHEDEWKKAFPVIGDNKGNAKLTIIPKPSNIPDLIKAISPLVKLSSAARALPGEHVLAIYDSRAELVQHAFEFLRTGLQNNENVMLVTDSIPIESARARLAVEWSDIDKLTVLEESGRVTIHTFSEWYMPEGSFDLQQAIDRLTALVNKSIADGKKGLRTVGDMTSFFDAGMIQEAIKYEQALDRKFTLPLIGICAYTNGNIQKLDNAAGHLLEAHHSRVVGGQRSS